MSGITEAQLETIISRYNKERETAPGPQLSETEFRRQVREITAAVERELAGQSFTKRYLEIHRRVAGLGKNPLRSEGNSQTSVSESGDK